MKTKVSFLLLLALIFIAGCYPPDRIVDFRSNATSLRGVVRAGWSLDPDWNVDVWVGATGRSGRTPSFVLLPQGCMEWEAANYRDFYVYAEAWRYGHNNRKVVMAKIRSPERITVSRSADRDGYGWSVEIRLGDDGFLYLYQEPIPRNIDIYRPQWGW